MFEIVFLATQWLGMFLTLVGLVKGAPKSLKLARAIAGERASARMWLSKLPNIAVRAISRPFQDPLLKRAGTPGYASLRGRTTVGAGLAGAQERRNRPHPLTGGLTAEPVCYHPQHRAARRGSMVATDRVRMIFADARALQAGPGPGAHRRGTRAVLRSEAAGVPAPEDPEAPLCPPLLHPPGPPARRLLLRGPLRAHRRDGTPDPGNSRLHRRRGEAGERRTTGPITLHGEAFPGKRLSVIVLLSNDSVTLIEKGICHPGLVGDQ